MHDSAGLRPPKQSATIVSCAYEHDQKGCVRHGREILRTRNTRKDGSRDGRNVSAGHAAFCQVQVLPDDRDQLRSQIQAGQLLTPHYGTPCILTLSQPSTMQSGPGWQAGMG